MENREAIERIQNDLKLHHDDLSGQYRTALRLAISALKKQEQDRWIPVTERPPEDGERVLITYDKNVIRATWDEMRGYFYDTSAMALDKEFVSAWRPLPEPYTEEES